VAYLLEFGVVIHSVLIGFLLGRAEEIDELRPLLIAICFHQFFEGIGLGCAIAAAKPSRLRAYVLAIIYILSTPVGVAIGLGVPAAEEHHDDLAADDGGHGHGFEDPNEVWSTGVLSALAAGILIYSGLVHMIVEDFNRCSVTDYKKKALMFISLLLGYGCMAVIGNWA
jgi:zinc transporter 1/2/3